MMIILGGIKSLTLNLQSVCRIWLLLFLIIIGTVINAQDTSATGDGIYVASPPQLEHFPDDLDSLKVDSFYRSKNIDLRECKSPNLYYEVYRWYNTCYRYGGNNSKGIDCSHFINMLYERIYGKTLESSAASIYIQCKPLKNGIKKAREGDLVFFKIKKKRISHVGIYLGNNKFAHATTKLGVIISDMDEEYYKKRFYKAGRVE